jgi:predicted permease
MKLLRSFLVGLRDLFGKRAVDRDLDAELKAFLESSIEDKVRSGMSPDEARRAARLELGSEDSVKEAVRDVGWEMVVDGIRRDVGYGVRSLARNPSFAIVAVATLAVGIGVTTAVFSVVNGVLLEPLPYRDSDQLVRIVEKAPARTAGSPPLRRTSMRWSEMKDWGKSATTLSEMAYTLSPPITLMRGPEGSTRLSGCLVSPNLFSMLAARAHLGRTLEVRDGAAGTRVVVISFGAWQRHFDADPSIIGRAVSLKTMGPEAGLLDGTPLTIVGVMPREFDYPMSYADFWAPVTDDSKAVAWPGSGNVIARLRDGVSTSAAADEANVVGESVRPRPTSGPLAQPLPAGIRRFDVERLKDQTVDEARPALRMLAGAVGVVLLIVCANVAGLLIARGTARHREIAVRLAIGAARGRIIRQLLTESVVLALAGGILGTLVAAGGVHLLRELASLNAEGVFRISFRGVGLPRLHEISVDGAMLALATALSTITALIVGILPAVSLSRVDDVRTLGLRGSGSQGGALPTEARIRTMLVGGQVALATILLIGAGLLVNSFSKLTRVDPGWNASGVVTVYLAMPPEYPIVRKAALVEDLIREMRLVPGVENAGFTYAGPLLGLIDTLGWFVPPGRTLEEMKGNPDNPYIRSVSHDFLQTMGARLVAGRWLDERDDAAAPPVLLVNRAVVERLFGGRNPVGQMVHLDGRMDLPPQQIVGVVDDMRQGRLDAAPTPQMFLDYRQVLALTQQRSMPPPAQERLAFGFLSFVARTNGDPRALMPSLRSLVGRVDPSLGIDALVPMDELVASSLTRQRFYASVTGFFAAIAAALSAIGIYGVLAYSVGRRRQEFGIRMALGATTRDIVSMVLRRGLLLAGIGIAVGIMASVALTRTLDGMLYDLTPLDPLTYVTVGLLFAGVTSVSSYLPARRATRIDPIGALRCD